MKVLVEGADGRREGADGRMEGGDLGRWRVVMEADGRVEEGCARFASP